MDKKLPSQKDLDKFRRYSKKLRIAAVSLTAIIIVGFWIYAKSLNERQARMELEWAAINDSIEAARIEKERLAEIENQRLHQIYDSIRIANLPKYSISDVHEMVRTVAPSYSWVYLWRKDNDNWIMKYHRESGNKEIWCYQRFNPTTRKFDKPIETNIVYYKNLTQDPVYIKSKNTKYSFTEDDVWETLKCYEDGKLIATFSRRDIKHDCRLPSTTHGPLAKRRIKALQSLPDEEDDYESIEDYYDDYDEDFYLYYGN